MYGCVSGDHVEQFGKLGSALAVHPGDGYFRREDEEREFQQNLVDAHIGRLFAGFALPGGSAGAVIEAGAGVALEQQVLLPLQRQRVEEVVVLEAETVRVLLEGVKGHSEGLAHEAAGCLEDLQPVFFLEAGPVSEAGQHSLVSDLHKRHNYTPPTHPYFLGYSLSLALLLSSSSRIKIIMNEELTTFLNSKCF
jgi:hypothetical protein